MKSLKVVALAASLTLMASGVAHAGAPFVAHNSLNAGLDQSDCVDNAVDLMKEKEFSRVLTSLGTYVVGTYGENKAVIVCQNSKGLVSFIASGPDRNVVMCITKGLRANFRAEDIVEEEEEEETGTTDTKRGCPFS